MTPSSLQDSRTRLLDAAVKLVREKGYCATRVEDICAVAGLTKGGFFHHFKSKDDLAAAAAEKWGADASALFATAPYQALEDPRDRLLAYVDFRIAMLEGPASSYSCYAGTLVQEVHETNEALCGAAARSLDSHIDMLAREIELAAPRGLLGGAGARGLAEHMHAVVQGAIVLAKAKGDAAPARASLAHLRRYLELLVPPVHPTENRKSHAE